MLAKITKIFIIFIFVSFPVFSDTDISKVFNAQLSDKEQAALKNGEILIRNIGNTSKMCLISEDLYAKKAIEKINSIKPNYCVEVIQFIPYKGNENLSKRMKLILQDVSSYKGIPYYSEHNEIWVDLYSNVTINSSKVVTENNEETEIINATLFMEPFGDIPSEIAILSKLNALYYENSNTDVIKYENITCIKKYNMKSVIIVIKTGENWVLYGIGGVNAPRVPFLTKRIELSFINRIKTFCNFVFKKISEV